MKLPQINTHPIITWSVAIPYATTFQMFWFLKSQCRLALQAVYLKEFTFKGVMVLVF